MNHRKSFRILNRDAAHRRATLKSMVTSLLKHERIRTTRPKALEVRRRAEKMITRAKLDSVHNRRIVRRQIEDKAVLAKLFTEVGPRFTARPGGYTRILKLGRRPGDAAEMVLLELVDRKTKEKPRREKKAAQAEAAPAESAKK
jgi:large subunit ribosomal protein L17